MFPHKKMTHSSILVAVSASIVFHPPGASEENGLPHTSTRTQLPQSMKIMHEIMYKLEVLYVLCVLLMGRQRNQVGLPHCLRTEGPRSRCCLDACSMPSTPLGCLLEWLSLRPHKARGGFPYSWFVQKKASLIPDLVSFYYTCCGQHF